MVIKITRNYYICRKRMYKRFLSERINIRIGSGKAIVVTGPRQVGKTTLIESILASKDYLVPLRKRPNFIKIR